MLNITDAQATTVAKLPKNEKAVPQNPLRVALDLRNEKITYKIREHSMQKLPSLWSLATRRHLEPSQCVPGATRTRRHAVDAFIELIVQAVASKA